MRKTRKRTDALVPQKHKYRGYPPYLVPGGAGNTVYAHAYDETGIGSTTDESRSVAYFNNNCDRARHKGGMYSTVEIREWR